MARKIIPLAKQAASHPSLSVCYASGVIKHKRKGLYEVEETRRREVHKTLCITKHFGRRCSVCPFSEGTLHVKA